MRGCDPASATRGVPVIIATHAVVAAVGQVQDNRKRGGEPGRRPEAKASPSLDAVVDGKSMWDPRGKRLGCSGPEAG